MKYNHICYYKNTHKRKESYKYNLLKLQLLCHKNNFKIFKRMNSLWKIGKVSRTANFSYSLKTVVCILDSAQWHFFVNKLLCKLTQIILLHLMTDIEIKLDGKFTETFTLTCISDTFSSPSSFYFFFDRWYKIMSNWPAH